MFLVLTELTEAMQEVTFKIKVSFLSPLPAVKIQMKTLVTDMVSVFERLIVCLSAASYQWPPPPTVTSDLLNRAARCVFVR